MKWLLLAFLGTTGVVIVATCLLLLLVRGRVRRHHRVDPKVATPAPLTWAVDPRAAAKLHRRLARVGRAAGAVAADHRPARSRRRRGEPGPVLQAATDLRRQAVALDAEVHRVSLLAPAARKQPLVELTAKTAELERAGLQLVALSSDLRSQPTLTGDDADITDATAQVDRLARAHDALTEIDEENGLATSGPLAGQRSQPGAGS